MLAIARFFAAVAAVATLVALYYLARFAWFAWRIRSLARRPRPTEGRRRFHEARLFPPGPKV